MLGEERRQRAQPWGRMELERKLKRGIGRTQSGHPPGSVTMGSFLRTATDSEYGPKGPFTEALSLSHYS